MALTRCLDCKRRTRGSRCPACQARRDQTRGTRQQRGYTDEHLRRARRAIDLHPWCSRCGSKRDLTGDHITPLARGGNPLGPLQVLCRSCNLRRNVTTIIA